MSAMAVAAAGLMGAAFAAAPAQPDGEAAPAAPGSPDCHTAVLDPGHDARANLGTEPIGPGSRKRKIKDGGGTRGVVTGTPEHVVTLRVSLALRRVLRRRGHCVVMTRDRAHEDRPSMGNVARARVANRAGADVFVRIHADGSTDRSMRGSATLYPAFRRGWTGDILPASRRAARVVQRALVRGLGTRDRGIVRRADITGFNWADVPVVLVELGFMTNPREDRRLSRPRYQRRAARALARGVERFVERGR